MSDEILDYPIFYASAKNGWAISDLTDEKKDMACILDSIIKSIPYNIIHFNCIYIIINFSSFLKIIP